MRVELGIDLLGAAPASFIRDLARRQNLDLSGLFDGDRFRRTDPEARAAAAILSRPEDFARIAAHVLEVRDYAELFVTPVADIPAFADRVAALREVPAGLVGRGVSKALAVAVAETGLDGIHLEEGADFQWCLDCAREAGLPVILSARDPAAIRAALIHDPVRLHHAFSAASDRALMDELAERGTILHLSPATEGWDDAGTLLHRDVRITIGNEAPAWFPADTPDRLADAHDWDEGVFAGLERNAIDAALCDDTTRARLKEMCNA